AQNEQRSNEESGRILSLENAWSQSRWPCIQASVLAVMEKVKGEEARIAFMEQ
ncbi:MAG: hypothetical protein QOD84_1357, partial [Acidobacteriaceae bacterium]